MGKTRLDMYKERMSAGSDGETVLYAAELGFFSSEAIHIKAEFLGKMGILGSMTRDQIIQRVISLSDNTNQDRLDVVGKEVVQLKNIRGAHADSGQLLADANALFDSVLLSIRQFCEDEHLPDDEEEGY